MPFEFPQDLIAAEKIVCDLLSLEDSGLFIQIDNEPTLRKKFVFSQAELKELRACVKVDDARMKVEVERSKAILNWNNYESSKESSQEAIAKQTVNLIVELSARWKVALFTASDSLLDYARMTIKQLEEGYVAKRIQFFHITQGKVQLSHTLERTKLIRRLFAWNRARVNVSEPPPKLALAPIKPYSIFKVSGGEYTVVQRLGRAGAQGAAFLARDLEKNEPLVGKCLKLYQAKSNDQKEVYVKKLKAFIKAKGLTPIPKQVCWPEELVLDSDNACQGFLMQHVPNATDMYDRVCNATPQSWDMRGVVSIALELTSIVEQLHQIQIDGDRLFLVDFNPKNFLIAENNGKPQLWVIDVDGFHTEKYPSPVRWEAFQSPAMARAAITGKTFKVTEHDELVAFSMLMFFIFMGGVHPYHHRSNDNRNAVKNTIATEFPYSIPGRKSDFLPPDGAERRWANLTPELQKVFAAHLDPRYQNRPNQVRGLKYWSSCLTKYKAVLNDNNRSFDSRIQKYDRNPDPFEFPSLAVKDKR